jgi:hypothetical protein
MKKKAVDEVVPTLVDLPKALKKRARQAAFAADQDFKAWLADAIREKLERSGE